MKSRKILISILTIIITLFSFQEGYAATNLKADGLTLINQLQTPVREIDVPISRDGSYREKIEKLRNIRSESLLYYEGIKNKREQLSEILKTKEKKDIPKFKEYIQSLKNLNMEIKNISNQSKLIMKEINKELKKKSPDISTKLDQLISSRELLNLKLAQKMVLMDEMIKNIS